jgi:transposase
MDYSNDLRKRILVLVEEGTYTQAEILRILDISRTGCNYFVKHAKARGSIERKSSNAGRHSKFDDKDIKRIKKYLSKHPDATLQEILDHTGKEASIMAIHRVLRKIGYKLKKSHYSPANKAGAM